MPASFLVLLPGKCRFELGTDVLLEISHALPERLEPGKQKILALKSTCQFRAEFEPIAEKVIVVISPGGYLADPAQYPFRRLRPGVRLRPLGPDFPGAA